MEGNILRKGSLMLLIIMIVLMMSCGISFADETGSTINVQITSGEHGTVNDRTGSFTETAASGSNLTLKCRADDGYVIGTVLVNDAEVESEDLDGILNEATGQLTLEGLTADLTVTVNFTEFGSDADDVIGSSGLATDLPEQLMSMEEEPGSLSTGEDPDAEVILDDQSQTGGEETQPGVSETDVTGTGESGSEDAEKQGSGKKKNDGDMEEGSGRTGSKTGKAGKGTTVKEVTDKSDSATGVYESSTSPKTGDDFPMQVIIAMTASLFALTGIAGRQILKRKRKVQEEAVR